MIYCSCVLFFSHLKRQPHKIVKNTQTIRRQQPTNSLSVFEDSVGWRLEG